MSMFRKKAYMLLLLLALSPTALIPINAQACTGGGDIIIVWFHWYHSPGIEADNATAIVVVGDLVTQAADEMGSCTAGLRFDENMVVSVDSIELVNTYTNMPIEGLEFLPDARSTASMEEMASAKGTRWAGFYGKPTKDFPNNVISEMQYRITVAPGVTEKQFTRMLEKKGLFLRGSADDDGKPNYEHLSTHPGHDIQIYN